MSHSKTSFNLNDLFKDPISQYTHVLCTVRILGQFNEYHPHSICQQILPNRSGVHHHLGQAVALLTSIHPSALTC